MANGTDQPVDVSDMPRDVVLRLTEREYGTLHQALCQCSTKYADDAKMYRGRGLLQLAIGLEQDRHRVLELAAKVRRQHIAGQ